MMRCRPGIVTNLEHEVAEFAKTPDQRCTATRCTASGERNSQYLFAIGNSSAGNCVMTRWPLSVTTTSSSMRAAEKPSVAGQ